MASGIRDKVAILGMGCTRFGERWNMGAEELMVEAFQECLADAGIEKDQIEAAWLGHCIEEIGMGKSRDAARRGPAAAPHRRHPDGELLRHRDRGLPGGRLRGGLRGLRHLPGHRRGKAQGHRLRRAAEPRLRTSARSSGSGSPTPRRRASSPSSPRPMPRSTRSPTRT